MTALTPTDQNLISAALTAGRNGSATLLLLAQAHEVAARHNMTEVVKELRNHLYQLLPYPKPSILTPRVLLSSVFVGVISGTIVTWLWRR